MPEQRNAPAAAVVSLRDLGWVPLAVLRIALLEAVGERRCNQALSDLDFDGTARVSMRTAAAADRAVVVLESWSIVAAVEDR